MAPDGKIAIEVTGLARIALRPDGSGDHRPGWLGGSIEEIRETLAGIDEARITDWIEARLRSDAPWLRVERVGTNLVARTELGRPQRLLLAGHTDTVPINGNVPSRRDGDVLHGCGTADMKSGLAVMIELARSVREPVVDVTYVFYEAEEVAEELEMSTEEVREILRMAQHPISLEKPIGEEEDSELGDFVEDEQAESPFDSASLMLRRSDIDEALSALPERDRRVIELRYGLDGSQPYTLEEVGRIFKVTRERVRQIEAKAVRKLQHPVRAKQLKGFLDALAANAAN